MTRISRGNAVDFAVACQVNQARIAKVHRQVFVLVHQVPYCRDRIIRWRLNAQMADGFGFAGPNEKCFLLAVGQECADFRQHRSGGRGLTRVPGKKRLAAFMVTVFGVENPDEIPRAGRRVHAALRGLRDGEMQPASVWGASMTLTAAPERVARFACLLRMTWRT